MAFAVKEQAEQVSFKRYIGVAKVKVAAVNPKEEEIAEILGNKGYTPTYTGKYEDGTPWVRVNFFLYTVPEENNGISTTATLQFTLTKTHCINRDQTKVQVIDKYGRTAWVTKEEYSAKAIPMYKNGPAPLDKDYRAAYRGEEKLTEFLKTWGRINTQKYENGAWVTLSDLTGCEARLENIDKLFEGDYKELQELVKAIPNNMIKVAIGVAEREDKQYTVVFNGMALSPFARDNSRIQKKLEEVKAYGAEANNIYDFGPLKEYVVDSTDFSKSTATSTAPTSSSVEANNVFSNASTAPSDPDLPF